MRIVSLVLVVILFISSSSVAQKFGYINSAAVLQDIPEVKAAESDLVGLQTQLKKKGEGMVTELQAKYAEVSEKEKKGELAPKQLQIESDALKAKEEEIGKYEQEMSAMLSQRREELLQPILDKVNKAIAEIAAENNYQYIFDSTTNVMLYADPTTDVTSLVRKKLGLPELAPAVAPK